MLHAHPPSAALFPYFLSCIQIGCVFLKKNKKKTQILFDILDGLTIDGVLLLRLVMS